MTTSTVTPTRRPPAFRGEDPAHDVADDVVDIWGHGSFPASDPPANW